MLINPLPTIYLILLTLPIENLRPEELTGTRIEHYPTRKGLTEGMGALWVGVPVEHSSQSRNYHYGYGYPSRRSLEISLRV
jgi:hypothetical protein